MAIAEKQEILEYLTDIMRRTDENTKAAEAFKAAELLGKYYGLFKGGDDDEAGDVIIIDDIKEDEKNQT